MALEQLKDIADFWSELTNKPQEAVVVSSTAYQLAVKSENIFLSISSVLDCPNFPVGWSLYWTIAKNGLGISQVGELGDQEMTNFKLAMLCLLNESNVPNFTLRTQKSYLTIQNNRKKGLLFQVVANELVGDPKTIGGAIYALSLR